jgi:hypothetical protein
MVKMRIFHDLNRRLLIDMIKEEWRLHRSLVGGLGSTFFPLIIFIMTATCALIAPLIARNLDQTTMLLMLHAASLFYGFYVGGFGSIGEQIMTKRLGQVNMLLQLPQIYPISLKKVMATFFVKDSLFYLVYTFVPMILGIAIAAPYVGVSIFGILRLGVTMFLAFMIGMGLSFVSSAASSRSRLLGAFAYLTIFIIALLVYPLNILQPQQVLLPLAYWVDRSLIWPILSIILSIGLATAGSLLIKERYEIKQTKFNNSLLKVNARLPAIGEIRPLVAKEWLELARSGNILPAVGGYALNLLVIVFISWLFDYGFGIPIGFNVVFFSAFVGFMGVMTYSSLTIIEHNDYLNMMPLGVDSLIKAKLVIYFILTSGLTAGYVILIGILKGEIYLIPQSLLVAACTSIYVVAVTAYLTGLWTNTLFFGAKTILKFASMVIPPLIIIEIGTIILPFNPGLATLMIASASILGLMASGLLLTRLKKRWSNASFSYISS